VGRTARAETDTGTNLGFEARLWQTADDLRNNMDAAEYKYVILGRSSATRGMLFYRLLEQAVSTKPITYENFVAVSRPKRTKPVPPTSS
jgi:hypothetical protein